MQVTFKKYTGRVQFARYGNGGTALMLLDERGVRIAVASVNMQDTGAPDPGPGQVYLKGWSENAGLPEALQAAGVVRLTGLQVPAGFADAILADLTPAALELQAQQELEG